MAISQEPKTGTSNAAKALLMGMALPGAKAKPEAIVGMRRKMARVEGDDPALANVKGSYDKFASWAFHEQLMSGGSAVIKEWLDVADKNPRFWSKLVPKSEGAADTMATALERRGPVAAANWLFGASLVGSSSGVAKVAESLKERGGAGEGWTMLRAAVWARVLSFVSDVDEGPSASALADTITNFITGRGAPVASVLYTPKEREAIRRFANTIRMAEKPSDGAKPQLSGNAPKMVRSIAGEISSFFKGAIAPDWDTALLAALTETR